MGCVLDDVQYSQCTSCFLCQDVCNKKAVKLSLDEDGFYKPIIDRTACTDCGLCSKKCPVLNDSRLVSNFNPHAFAAWNSNEIKLRESSSGGIAYLIGKLIIENCGVVYGVEWLNGIPRFGKAESIEQLESFKGSKYLQPIAADIYNDIKSSINLGLTVLFAGLPCQVRALKNYVSSDQLITIDILCAGVPSQLLWTKYCKWKFGGKNITSANFRSKERGWRSSTIKCYSGRRELLSEVNYRNRFFLGFNSTLFYNSACYECRFNTIPRLGDITLGDYWGAPKELDNKDGVSIVLANTKKGLDLIKSLNKSDVIISEVDFEEAVKGNYRINHDHRDVPKERFEALKMLKEGKFKKCSDKYFKPTTLFERVVRKIWKLI